MEGINRKYNGKNFLVTTGHKKHPGLDTVEKTGLGRLHHTDRAAMYSRIKSGVCIKISKTKKFGGHDNFSIDFLKALDHGNLTYLKCK